MRLAPEFGAQHIQRDTTGASLDALEAVVLEAD
jgi:hypothetical protein